MTVQTFNFTTGQSTLPDIGTLSYNGCTFSPLFITNISGKVISDEARRTTKLMEYKLSVDGYVTPPASALSISPSMATMRRLLTAQSGALTYSGRGFDILPATTTEVAWGPMPELLDFQPLGGSNSAKVKWEVTFRISAVPAGTHLPRGRDNVHNFPLLQFNYETNLTQGEDYYSSMTVKGTMEILMNRRINTAADGRTLTATIDSIRAELDRRIFSGIDISKFYVIHRDYNITRDKRMMLFNVQIDEKPYMDMPPNCSIARGSFNVRPVKAGPGLVTWLCTLRATYTVRADKARRWAWTAFLLLLFLRMRTPRSDPFRPNQPPRDDPPDPLPPTISEVNVVSGQTGEPIIVGDTLRPGVQIDIELRNYIRNVFRGLGVAMPEANRRNWLIDFSFDEGLYKDSKTITFSATWRMVTTLSNILIGSGLWKKLPEINLQRRNLWALSMASVSGSNSWLSSRLDPSADVIIDFGY